MKDSAVQLIVGLGNPGPAYRHNRHNLGFMVVEELARRLKLEFRPGGPTYMVAEQVGGPGNVVLLKPLTYMNLSGEAIIAWSRDSGVAVTGTVPAGAAEPGEAPEPGEIYLSEDTEAVRPLVICDDLSLPLGSVRLRPRGSSGGQNGLASVIELIGGEEFPRQRLGIAPVGKEIDPADWPDHVLADFDPQERPVALDLVMHARAAVEFWLENGLEGAVSRFNRRIRPEPEPGEA